MKKNMRKNLEELQMHVTVVEDVLVYATHFQPFLILLMSLIHLKLMALNIPNSNQSSMIVICVTYVL